MDSSIYNTSVRDKIILVALILFGVCSFVSIWLDRSLGSVMVGIIGSIVAGLFGIYKGNPSTSQPNSSGDSPAPGSLPPPGVAPETKET